MMACLKFYRIFPPHLPLHLVIRTGIAQQPSGICYAGLT